MTNVFEINRPDDETIIISLNGVKLGQYDHDQHGWAGMEAVESLVQTIAHEQLNSASGEAVRWNDELGTTERHRDGKECTA